MSELGAFAKELLEASVIKGDSAALFNALTDDFKEKFTISELSRRLAQMEDQHGMFTRIGEPTEPVPNPEHEGFWIFDVPMYVNKMEWFAHLSMNADKKLNDFSFTRRPFYIAPAYFNPHKVETLELSTLPVVKFVKPTKRKTRKLPIAVFVHAVVEVGYDGQMGLRYPFRDFDFIAQKKVGLVRGSYENYGEPDTVVALARNEIDFAAKLTENGGIFLMLHSVAALFLPRIMELRGDQVKGVILVNPAWEAPPGSGLDNMTSDKVPHGKPVLLIGSEFDQVMVPDHFEAWKKALGTDAEAVWQEKADHFLMTTDNIPDVQDYMKTEGHVSELALRKIATWVKGHWSDE